MKRNFIANTFAVTVASAFALGFAPAAEADGPGCSNATLKGVYAYTNTGFITAPPAEAGPFAGVGTQTFDGNGATTATAWVSQNGNIFKPNITGSYTVNPDCTGTFLLQISIQTPPLNFTNHVFFVVQPGGARFWAINTDPGTAITTEARKQLPPGNSRP